MSEQTPNLKLTGKDLINIGIFSAIYFVLSFVGMFLAIIPVLWIIMPGIIAILSGIPFMLLCVKVQKPGVPLLMGLITGLLYYVTGQFTMVILATFVIGCVLSEIVRWRSKYGSFKWNTVAFIWLFKDSFFTQIADQGMPEAYVTTMESLSSIPMFVVMILTPIIGGLIGAYLARGIFKKHFKKAGMI